MRQEEQPAPTHVVSATYAQHWKFPTQAPADDQEVLAWNHCQGFFISKYGHTDTLGWGFYGFAPDYSNPRLDAVQLWTELPDSDVLFNLMARATVCVAVTQATECSSYPKAKPTDGAGPRDAAVASLD